ncbi:hypothetical protein [Evansella halocellulosilytica]|uniref:hypothetical protein n=1 Tax=Evansella halocellulosilytica TaxID=2011013 RepID=UPI000BB77F77|nr:hypothetical protein [Evansella halocellulosilytica]
MRKVYFVYLVSIFTGLGSMTMINMSALSVSIIDILSIILILLFFGILIRGRRLLIINSIEFFIIIFFILCLILYPLLGVIIYSYPLYLVTDIFNWSLFLFSLLIGINIYIKQKSNFLKDLFLVLKIAIIVHLIFVMLQFLNFNTSLSLNYILDLRFSDSDLRYGHINRFTGAFSSIAALGTFSVFANILFLQRIIFSKDKNIIWFIMSMITLISSGQRTSFLIWILFFTIILGIIAYKNNKLYKYFFIGIMVMTILSIITYFSWILNLGRIQSQFSRIIEVLDLLMFRTSVGEASGRGLRWTDSITYLIDQNKEIFGLLANPGHVFPGEAIDSYYVIMFIQGGPFLLILFIVLMALLIIKSYEIISKDPLFSHVSIISFIVVMLGSFAQASLNNSIGRGILLVGIISLLISRKNNNNFSNNKGVNV